MSNFARILFIDKHIREAGVVSTKKVVDEFEISERMVRKDIEFMKEQLEAPVFYSKELGGYIYESAFTLLQLANEKILLTFSFVKSIIRTFNYVPYVSDEIIGKLSGYLSEPYRKLSDMILYELSGYEIINKDFFNCIIRSLLTKKKAEIVYKGFNKEEKKRIIEPLKLINYAGDWYLTAFCYNAGQLRLFKISRIGAGTLTDQDFEQDISNETIDGYLSKGFGIFAGASGPDAIKRVQIRFYNAAYIVMKSKSLHKDEKVTTGDDIERGEFIEFDIPVASYNEIIGKVLQYGENAEVIGPPDFKEAWMKSIRNMYIRYCQTI